MVGLLAVLLMAFFVAIQTPLVQTRLSKVGLNQLAAIMDGRVQYDEIKVMTSGVIVIHNLKLIDTHPYEEDINGRGWAPADTVAHIDKLTATFGLSGLFRKEGLHMGRVTIEGGSFHLSAKLGGFLIQILPKKPGAEKKPKKEKKPRDPELFKIVVLSLQKQ